jgi:hypothetical protein
MLTSALTAGKLLSYFPQNIFTLTSGRKPRPTPNLDRLIPAKSSFLGVEQAFMPAVSRRENWASAPEVTISHQGCPCSKRRRPERSEAERHKLIPENVRNLHKDLSPIVDERIPSPQQPIRRLSRSARKTRTCSLQGWIKVLQIAVVARVDCRAGIQQVGEQHITVKALAARESSQPGI